MSARSAVIRWVDAQLSPLDLLDELAPAAEPRHVGQGYLAWCPFHDDREVQADGAPGTPFLYIVYNRRYSWSWRCLSSNRSQHDGPMRHTFRLWQELLGADITTAIRAATRRWGPTEPAEMAEDPADR